MSESLLINKSLTDAEIYKSLLLQIESLLCKKEPIISNLANFTAALKEAFDKISWIGFYFLKGDKLILGPFQGKIACTKIELGKGVCGTSALKKETIIVDDVNKFPGHIVCDADSKSEIVVPLKNEKQIFGVLDLDSYHYSAFNNIDKENLEKLCNIIVKKIDLTKIHNLLS